MVRYKHTKTCTSRQAADRLY